MRKLTIMGLVSAVLQIATIVAAQVNSDNMNCGQEPSVGASSLAVTGCPTSASQDNPQNAEWTVDALTLHQRALDHVKRGDRDRAMIDINEAIKLNPYVAETYYTRGTIYASAKDYDSAMQDYDKAISLNPALAEAFHQRALLHERKQDHRQAIKDLDVAIGLEPNTPGTLRDRGNVYRAMGDYDRAVDDYQAAMSLDRNMIDPYSMANLLFFQGRFVQSAQTMQQAVKAKPENQHAVLWRYLALAKASGVQVATRELSEQSARLIDKRWPAPVIDYYLGKIDDGAMQAAANTTEATDKVEPNCQAVFYAAEAKLLKGTNEDAIALLRAARSQCAPDTTFYHGASSELKRLGQLPTDATAHQSN